MSEPDVQDDRHKPFNQQEKQRLVDDINAICNSLGSVDVNDGTYMIDRDCKPCLKEIVRYLNADTKDHIVRTTLGSINIVGSDLIPLINQYCDYNDGDQDLFSLILRLISNLTASVLLLFENQSVPSEPEMAILYRKLLKCLYSYKESFSNDEKVWKILNIHLRHTEDEIPFERLIILIRNILHIPVDTTDDQGIHGDFDAHEMCLYQMDKSGLFDTIIHIASNTQRGTEFCFHITEIIYLMLRDKNPATIIAARSNNNKRKLSDDDPDRKRYLELSARDRRERDSKRLKPIGSRFRNSAFSMTNVRSLSNDPIIVRRLIDSREAFQFDQGKTELKKAKNKKPFASELSSITISDRNTKPSRVSYSLQVFCKKFVEKVYANYMQQIKHNLIQKKTAENDETYYLWAVQFFTCFNRLFCLSLDYISETLSTSTLHFIQILITTYQDKLKMEKSRTHQDKISKRLHLAIRAYREILVLIGTIKEDSDFYKTIESIKKNIFTEIEYSSILLTLFQQYEESKFCDDYTKDLIKTNHVFLDLFEQYTKTHNPVDMEDNDDADEDKKSSDEEANGEGEQQPQPEGGEEFLDGEATKKKQKKKRAKRKKKKLEFRAVHFMSRYCCPEVVKVYLATLGQFKTNEDEVNLAILRFYERVVFDCHYEVMLCQLSVFRVLIAIIKQHTGLPSHEGFSELGKHLIRHFGKMANKKRWMYQELLFWKSANDVLEIENAVDPPPPPPVAEENLNEDEIPFTNETPFDAEQENVVGAEDGDAVAGAPENKQPTLDELLAGLGSDLSSSEDEASERGRGDGGDDDGSDGSNASDEEASDAAADDIAVVDTAAASESPVVDAPVVETPTVGGSNVDSNDVDAGGASDDSDDDDASAGGRGNGADAGGLKEFSILSDDSEPDDSNHGDSSKLVEKTRNKIVEDDDDDE